MKYLVTLTYTQASRATVEIEAESQEEAQELAENIQADEVNDFNPIDGELYVEGVEEKDDTDKTKYEVVVPEEV